jgi:vancomycin resistance protein YoaR
MGWDWLLAIVLMFQQAERPEQVRMEHNGQQVAIVRLADYIHPLPGIPLIDDQKLSALVQSVDKATNQKPVNATLDGGGRIVPEQPGSRLNKLELQRRLHGLIYEGGTDHMELPMQPAYAKVDSELLAAIKVKRVGQYNTYYNNGNHNRSHNITLAAKAINNHVVFPGETFSFNQVVGRRTAKAGYKRAPVIVRGEVYEDIGGGICQVSSTLFNAVDRAGLSIVERYSHSRHVPYVPPRRDATVSWDGPDFVFRNDYKQPVLIRAYAGAGQVNVVVCSSELIEIKQREVPRATKELPKEIQLERNVSGAP